jgi:hypothetical protein
MNINKKKEINTAKKIINEYADKINFYMKQNELLKSQLEDMSITVLNNKNILYNFMLESTNDKKELQAFEEIRMENERISQKNLEKNKEIESLEVKVFNFNKILIKINL